ncbi:MAG: protein-L-isoaspartate O-methyltransferase [Arenimonas sp.]|nr:protein-L-isoaspartate O-methyltransferase [Arenimonas sp.]MBP6310299.1 protein-L-isoaspartate O-methyltransferase [Arenimonas sp.]
MTFNIEQARNAMVEQQVRPWNVVDLQVLETLNSIPRELFVPEAYQKLAFTDTALPIGQDQWTLKPVIEGRLLQALKIQANDEVLVVGTGSAFLTACMAQMARAVTSIDIHAEFIELAKTKLKSLELNNVEFEHADVFNYQPNRQFNVIAITGAMALVPENIKNWLLPNGRLFVIHGQSPVQEALLITRVGESFESESLFETDVPYLTGAQHKPQFSL